MVSVDDYGSIINNVAHSIRGNANGAVSWEDLYQEGYIAVWKHIESGGVIAKGLIITVAKRAMIDYMVRTKEFFRNGAVHRYNMVPTDLYTHASRMSKTTSVIEAAIWEDRKACTRVDDSIVAYHEREIATALAALTKAEQRYVMERFWNHNNTTELSDVFGYNPGSIWSRVKPRLAEKFGHLRELV